MPSIFRKIVNSISDCRYELLLLLLYRYTCVLQLLLLPLEAGTSSKLVLLILTVNVPLYGSMRLAKPAEAGSIRICGAAAFFPSRYRVLIASFLLNYSCLRSSRFQSDSEISLFSVFRASGLTDAVFGKLESFTTLYLLRTLDKILCVSIWINFSFYNTLYGSTRNINKLFK